jgi:hypothetical protein
LLCTRQSFPFLPTPTAIQKSNPNQVQQKTFVANITTQVVERHIVRGLESIFSPLAVNRLSDKDVEAIASEPLEAQRERARLEVKIDMLKKGHEAFRSAMGVAVR